MLDCASLEAASRLRPEPCQELIAMDRHVIHIINIINIVIVIVIISFTDG